MERYDAVVISGGGNKGILSLGALQYEFEKGRYDPSYTRIYAGTSIGAVLSLLMICGYTPIDAFTEIYNMAYFFDIEDRCGIWDVIKFMGLMSIKGFEQRIEELVKAKIGSVPTLKELKEITGKILVTTGANVTKMKTEYYTYKTRPDLGCIEAVKISSSLPLIFQRSYHDNCCVVDGGMIDNFPLRYIDDGKMKILGIVTMGSDLTSFSENRLIGYLYRLIVMPINSNTELLCDLVKPNTHMIKIIADGVPFFTMALSKELKMELFVRGYAEAERSDQLIPLEIPGWIDTIHNLESSLS